MKTHRIPFLSTLALGLAALCSPLTQAQIEQSELDRLISALEGDDHAARQDARMALQDAVSTAAAPGNDAARQSVEAQLIERLQQPLERTTRLWLLRQIESIGTEAAIDPLVGLTKDPDSHVADGARMALQGNRSQRASAALLELLRETPDSDQALGYIGSLSARAYAPAADDFANYLKGESQALALAATAGLIRIGNAKALRLLLEYRDQSEGERKAAIEAGLLELSKDYNLLSELSFSGSNRSIRAGAFSRCIELSPGRANRLLQDALADVALLHRGDLIAAAVRSGRPALVRSILQSLPQLPPAEQSIAIGAFPPKRSKPAERAALALVAADHEPVKVQAIEALGRVGSRDSLPALLANLESRSRELRETAAEAIARVDDPRVDRQLLQAAQKGEAEERAVAIKALGYRASPGAAALVNRLASDSAESTPLRKEALSAMELIGNADSFSVLTGLIVEDAGSGLRRDAQLVLKRMTLRTADPDRAWAAFEASLQGADEDARAALLAVLDAAPTPGAIEFAKSLWDEGDAKTRSAILRVLPLWRNWDGGFALADFADREDTSPADRQASFSGIGRLILGSSPNHPMEGKFEVAGLALSKAQTDEERRPILDGFRYSTWRERAYVNDNDVDPGLKEAVLEYAD